MAVSIGYLFYFSNNVSVKKFTAVVRFDVVNVCSFEFEHLLRYWPESSNDEIVQALPSDRADEPLTTTVQI
jgi:hypothetical protein